MSITVTETAPVAEQQLNRANAEKGNWIPFAKSHQPTRREPMKLKGLFKNFSQKDITPFMGTEIFDINVVDWLNSPNDGNEFLRELAITVSQRGFCVLRSQTDLTIPDEKHLVQRLGQVSGRPDTSTFSIHPTNHMVMPDGTVDPEVMAPSRNPKHKIHFKQSGFSRDSAKNQSHADVWHSDGTYEPVPPDYTVLHMVQMPAEGSGGDTMFASAYEAYDMLSPKMQKFLENLKAVFMPAGHVPERIVDHMWKGPRGSPENVGPELRALHPCVRTNPITGWKSLLAFGHHLEEFEGLGNVENRMLKEFVTRLVTENHQIQTRLRWQPGDLVIWDNRAVYHVSPNYSRRLELH